LIFPPFGAENELLERKGFGPHADFEPTNLEQRDQLVFFRNGCKGQPLFATTNPGQRKKFCRFALKIIFG